MIGARLGPYEITAKLGEGARLSHYRRWLEREGTFAAEVHSRHRDFFAWVESAVEAR